MPVLEFGDVCVDSERYRAQLLVKAVTTWPADEVSRNGFLASVSAYHLGDLKQLISDLPDLDKMTDEQKAVDVMIDRDDFRFAEDIFNSWFEANGGHHALISAPSLLDYVKEMTDAVPDQFGAGLILNVIRQMATYPDGIQGGASVNKAVYIVENIGKGLPVPQNSHDLRRAWSTYKPVAHFCAAKFETYMLYGKGENCDPLESCPLESVSLVDRGLTRFLDFLNRVEKYYNFATTFIPTRSKEPLIDPDTAWQLPKEKLWPVSFAPPPFDHKIIELAKKYRAPQPAQ